MKLSEKTQRSLCCPVCRSPLESRGDLLRCDGPGAGCGTVFPLVDGLPILLNEGTSVFRIEDFVLHRELFFSLRPNRLKTTALAALPRITRNLSAERNYRKLAGLLSPVSSARVLVVGGSVMGEGMRTFAANPALEIVHTDVSFGERTMLICDAHDLPFMDGSFDAVVLQAVLEHVADPYRCLEEAHRVLKDSGFVYVEVPFMQQVHGAEYDFTRFTHLGLRRLCRRFEEIDSGVSGGPGMALAWAWQYFLLSFATSKQVRAGIKVFARLTSFFWTFFDPLLARRPGALDAASGCYFLGRKSDRVLTDRELVGLFRGARDL